MENKFQKLVKQFKNVKLFAKQNQMNQDDIVLIHLSITALNSFVQKGQLNELNAVDFAEKFFADDLEPMPESLKEDALRKILNGDNKEVGIFKVLHWFKQYPEIWN